MFDIRIMSYCRFQLILLLPLDNSSSGFTKILKLDVALYQFI